MNTSSGKPARSETESRKEEHLTLCTDPSRYQVEGGGAGFEGVRFIHDAMPEIADDELDTSVEFLSRKIALPFFISCMTGGSEGGFRANKALAAAAQELGIPVGLGSIRILLRTPDLFPHFHLKPLAPDVPVIANIGAVQVRDGGMDELLALLEKLEVQALAVHLNPGQELFQPGGDRDFRGVKDALARLMERCPLPVIVKETGFGIMPCHVRELLKTGAAYVDLAGGGGTNWISVESYRLPEEEHAAARVRTGHRPAPHGPPARLIRRLGRAPPCLGRHTHRHGRGKGARHGRGARRLRAPGDTGSCPRRRRGSGRLLSPPGKDAQDDHAADSITDGTGSAERQNVV